MNKLMLTTVTVATLFSACGKEASQKTKNKIKDEAYVIQLDTRCEAEDGYACVKLAQAARHQTRGPVILKKLSNFNQKDTYDKAFRILNQECEALNGRACYAIGEFLQVEKRYSNMLAERFKFEHDMYQHFNKQAKVYYKRGCDVKHPQSCGDLWSVLRYTASDNELNTIGMKEGTYYAANCDVTSRQNKECRRAASAYLLHVKTKQGVQLALEIYEARCANGFTYDCRQLVALYSSDKSGTKDKALADKYRQKLCDIRGTEYCSL